MRVAGRRHAYTTAHWLTSRLPMPGWLVMLLAFDTIHNILIARVIRDVPPATVRASALFRAMDGAAPLSVWAYALGTYAALVIVGVLTRRARVAALGCLGAFVWWLNISILLLVKTPMVSWFLPTFFLLPTALPLICQTLLWGVTVPRWRRA